MVHLVKFYLGAKAVRTRFQTVPELKVCEVVMASRHMLQIKCADSVIGFWST